MRLQEMAALTLTSGSNKSPHPDISTTITKERLAEPGGGLKAGLGRRTEQWVQNVRATCGVRSPEYMFAKYYLLQTNFYR